MYELPAGLTCLATAQWLARRHADYLLGVEEGADFSRWRSSLAASEVTRVLALGDVLVQRWAASLEQTIGPLDRRAPAAWLERAAAHVASQLLTPFDVDFDDCERRLYAQVEDPHFDAATPSRLLRGLVNCDGHSHFVALVLSAWTRTEVVSVPSHRLVRVPSFVRGPTLVDRLRGSVTVFIDAYAELPPFVLAAAAPGFTSLADLDALLAARDRRYVARGAGPGDPLRSLADYQRAKRMRTVARSPAQPWPSSIVPPEPAPAPAPDDVIGVYFEARAHHLFGAPEDAARLYRSLVDPERERPGWAGSFRAAARIFAARLAQ